jgi:hypothetical protein
MEASMNILLDLILDSLEHLFIAMTYVINTDTPCKVDIFLAFNIFYDCPFGIFGKDGMDIKGALRYVPIPLCK